MKPEVKTTSRFIRWPNYQNKTKMKSSIFGKTIGLDSQN